MLKKSPIRRRYKSQEQRNKDRYESEKTNTFFAYIEANTEGRSEVSGVRLPRMNKGTMHHLYEKSSHPEVMYSLENIMRVTLEEHQNLNNDVNYYEVARQNRLHMMEDFEAYINQSSSWSDEYDRIKKGELDG